MRPPSVITAGEYARAFCRSVPSRYCAMAAPFVRDRPGARPPLRRGPRPAVGLAWPDLAVGEDQLGAAADHLGPVGNGGLRPLGVGAGLVVEVAVRVDAAQEHRGLAE